MVHVLGKYVVIRYLDPFGWGFRDGLEIRVSGWPFRVGVSGLGLGVWGSALQWPL